MLGNIIRKRLNTQRWGNLYSNTCVCITNLLKYGNFSFNPNTKSFWDNRFSNIDKFWRNEHYFHILDIFPRMEEFSCLDIGCAIGDGCELLQKEFPQAKITGVDISGTGIQKAMQKTDCIEYYILDILKDPIATKYDYITIIQTLEHFDKPFFVIDKCLQYVNKSLIISVPYRQKVSSPGLINKSEHRWSFDEDIFRDYNHKVVKVSDFIKSTDAKCIIYQIFPQ
ncbi:MAG: class I SAM-dependent methyltransferase [Phycisphaerae bacterium]|nr:class I SAM-dependent methyltransferase [Phycisphaerae bacterium]